MVSSSGKLCLVTEGSLSLWSMGLVESIKSTAKGHSKSLTDSEDRLKQRGE
jgi:hypothetical protein